MVSLFANTVAGGEMCKFWMLTLSRQETGYELPANSFVHGCPAEVQE